MATRARIGMLYPGGYVLSVYCHWDGYPNHVGKILTEHWTDEEKIKEMIKLGDMSTLGEKIGVEVDFDSPSTDDQCRFYGRDRGEENTQARRDALPELYWKNTADIGVAYKYLFKDGQWLVNRAQLNDLAKEERIGS